jgi:DASS family divalent anion:Na+ symporter
LDIRSLAPGERIFSRDCPADQLFLLLHGSVHLLHPDRPPILITEGCLGEECATDAPAYLSNAEALSPTEVIVVPRLNLEPILAAAPDLRSAFHLDLLRRLSGSTIQPRAAKPTASETPISLQSLAGWAITLLCFVVPPLLKGRVPLNTQQLAFLAIFLATASMWVFSLVDEYIPGVFALTATLIQGLVPPQVILGGFSSDAFLMALSILGLGAVITVSGLSYRFLLLLLRWMPNNQFGYNAGLMLTGTLLTPTLPTINGRVALVTPFLQDILEGLRFQGGKPAATRLATTAFTGVTLFSAVFLSSKSVNFVVLSLLPAQIQNDFQWMAWLVAASVMGIVSLGLYLAAVGYLFRNQEPSRLSQDHIQGQLKALGPLSTREWAGVVGFIAFLVGIVTTATHHIDPPWLGLAVLYFLLIFGVLKKEEFKTRIDWSFLVYLGALVGIVNTFNHLGLDKALAAAMPNLSGYMRTNFPLFILILAGLTFLVRLVIPISPAIVILATVFMPIASTQGVNPWVVGFIILNLGEMWFFPYQCSYYLQFRASTLPDGLYDERSFLRFNLLMNGLKIAALYASLPFWHMLGLL